MRCDDHDAPFPGVQVKASKDGAGGKDHRQTQAGLRDPEEAGAAATEYLRLFALTALAYMWALTAKAVLAKPAAARTPFHQAKLATARFYMTRLLPQTSGLFAAIMAGKGPIMGLDEAAF